MNSIFTEITAAFGALWKCRHRGDSLEIITPFPTSTDMYVSVFLTRRGGSWIVSDGGWMHQCVYSQNIPWEDKIYNRVVEFFEEDFRIKTTLSPAGVTYYYKWTDDKRLVPNIVFDLANFISMTISTSLVQFRPMTDQDRFGRQVKQLLLSRIKEDRLKFNSSFSETLPSAKFGAVVASPTGKYSLINFVAGSNISYIRTGIARSNMNFDFLSYSPVADKVRNKIVLIDDSVLPIESPKIAPFIDICRNKNQLPIPWSSGKKDLIESVTA